MPSEGISYRENVRKERDKDRKMYLLSHTPLQKGNGLSTGMEKNIISVIYEGEDRKEMQMILTIKSGLYTFAFEEVEGGIGYSVSRDTAPAPIRLYRTQKPLIIMLKDYAAKMVDYEAAYDKVEMTDGKAVATGSVKTLLGSTFTFTDTITPYNDDGTFLYERHVEVSQAHDDDLGFDSRISLGVLQGQKCKDFNYFAPGAIYRQNQWTRPHALISELDREDYHWFRDAHFTLPLFSMQHIQSGDAVTFARAKYDIHPSEINERTYDCVTSPTFNYGSLGVSKPGGLSMDYVYPGTEGYDEETTPYARGVYKYQFGFRRRYHPVTDGFAQDCSIFMRFTRFNEYRDMFRDAWRYFYNEHKPMIRDVDLKKFFEVEINLLDSLCRDYYGSWGVPFKCLLPTGEIGIVDYEMGFIGQQPNIAYQLIRHGTKAGKPETVQKGVNVIDFWVHNSLTDWGLPKCWYDCCPPKWLDQPIWTRMIADGMEGILDGYNFLRKEGVEKPEWLAYCKRVADWFVENADPEGSWPRGWDFSGKVVEDSRGNTSNIIRFLVQLYLTTGDKRYKQAALKAGEWCYEHVYLGFQYRGGTCDNGPFMDNESGIYACFAFLSLYDVTGDEKWKTALIGAADYTATYTWSWSYPIFCVNEKHAFRHVDFTGMSPVTAGRGGGGDVYMGAVTYIFYRLYLLTGDKYWLDYDLFLDRNTRTSYDLDGSFGYGRIGLCEEGGGGYSSFSQSGVYAWLPWCTQIQVDPLSRMMDTFGVYSVEEAEKLPREELLKRNEIYKDYPYYGK